MGMIQRRQTTHSAGFRDTGGQIRRHHYFQFDVNNTQVISGYFGTLAGQEISVDWGDGTARNTYSGINQAWSHDYGSAGDRTVRIFGSVVLTKFQMDRAGANISLDIANLPPLLTSFFACGVNTCYGDIGTLPPLLTFFYCCGGNTCYGDIGSLPASLTYFLCFGYNTCYGDIGSLPALLSVFACYGNDIINDYSGKIWGTKPATFRLRPVAPGGLSTAEIDSLLIDLDADCAWAAGDVIELIGTNAARSAASDAAVATMVAEGATVTTN